MTYLTKKENFNRLKKEEDKINNQLDVSIHSLNRPDENNYSKNNNNYNNNYNDSLNSYYVNEKNKNKNKKDNIQFKKNELTEILGKINKEFYKNNKNYNANIYEWFNKDYLNSKNIDKYSNNVNNNYSKKSGFTNNQKSLNDEKRKFNYNSNKNININKINKILNSNQFHIRQNSSPINNYNIQKYDRYKKNNIKNKISYFILKSPHKKEENENIDDKNNNEYDEEKNHKVVLVKSIHKSVKKNKNYSQKKKFKKKISPFYNDLNLRNNIKKNTFSNPKDINNMANFYNFWTDNDKHTGGKINLSLNNIYGNNIDFYLNLYYIVKIQSVWRGYYLRNSLLGKSNINSKLNIFYKQKLLLKTLFYILNKNAKKINFQIFKENINKNKNNKKQKYDLSSSLLNNLNNYYQKYYKAKNGRNYLLYNKKRLGEVKNNLNIYNKINSEINTPKMKRCNTKINYNINNNKMNHNDYTNYKILKTHAICYKSHKKNKKIEIENNKEKEKEKENNKEKVIKHIKRLNKNKSDRKFIYILPDGKTTSHFTINNINNINTINTNTLDKNKNYDNKRNNLTSPFNIENNNKLYKYKEYIYFLFLLFAIIQRVNYRGFFKEFIKNLKEKRNINLKQMKKNILLKIIKNKDRKILLFYFKIFKEKILTERIKNDILNKNMYNNFNIINNINSTDNILTIHNENNENKDSKINKLHSKKHIKIKKINRAISVNQSQNKNKSNYLNNNAYSDLLKSSSISPKKIIIKKITNNINPLKLGEYYKFTPEYLLKKKMIEIFTNFDKKEIKQFFRRWKFKTNKARKKFLIYFIMLMKEYFCNDKSLKSNKEYTIGKYMFFWYRKSFFN